MAGADLIYVIIFWTVIFGCMYQFLFCICKGGWSWYGDRMRTWSVLGAFGQGERQEKKRNDDAC